MKALSEASNPIYSHSALLMYTIFPMHAAVVRFDIFQSTQASSHLFQFVNTP